MRVVIFLLLVVALPLQSWAAPGGNRSKEEPPAEGPATVGVFDVTQYGAIGDGAKDDWAAIQDAIYAAELVGGKVYFPAGTYRINTGLVHAPDNFSTYPVTFIGESPNSSRVVFKGSGNALVVGDGYTHLYGFGIENLCFSGDSTANNGGLLMRLCHRWRIVNSKFDTFGTNGIEGQGCWGGLILSTRSVANGQNGIDFYGLGPNESNSITITDSSIIDWNGEWGVRFTGTSGQVANISIEGNIITANGLGGVRFDGVFGAVISHNELEANDKQAAPGAAMGIEVTGAVYQSVSISVRNNLITSMNTAGHGGLGIRLDNTDSVHIFDNYFIANAVASIEVLETSLNFNLGSNYSGDATYLLNNWEEGINYTLHNWYRNGAFNAWSSGTSGSPDSHSKVRAIAGRDTVNTRHAGQSAKITAAGPWAYIEQTLPSRDSKLLRGQRLTLSAWCYAPSSNDQYQVIAVSDFGGQSPSTTPSAVIPADDRWHFITMETVVDRDATGISIQLYCNYGPNLDSDDILYVSGVTLRQGRFAAPYSPHPEEALGILKATRGWDPDSMANDGDTVSTTITVVGAAVGDWALASLSTVGSNDVLIAAHVVAADTVRVVLTNKTGGSLNIGPGALNVRVQKF
jgi:hypothetical protein